jgi:hypothetical protein
MKKETISKTTFAMMLAVAIFFDVALSVIQLIPFAGSVAAMVFNVVPFMLFYLWYTMEGISFVNPKKAFTFFGCSFIEFIPFANILPAWTASVIIMYVLQKKDILLEKAAGVVGGVAGVTAIAGTGAKMLGAKKLGNSLTETSKNLKEKSQSMRADSKPLQNTKNPSVGNEIRPTKKQNPLDKPKDMGEFSTSARDEGDRLALSNDMKEFSTKEGDERDELSLSNETKELNNIAQFSKNDHNKDWVFPKR